MNFLVLPFWLVLLDMPKELKAPGTIWFSSLASFTAAGASVIFPKPLCWISVVLVGAIMTVDLSLLCFGIKFESAVASVLFCLSIWFYRAFSIQVFLIITAVSLLVIIKDYLFEQSKIDSTLFCFIGAASFLPPDIGPVFWLLVIHLPCTLQAIKNELPPAYIVISFCVIVWFSVLLQNDGLPLVRSTVAFIFMRTWLYLT